MGVDLEKKITEYRGRKEITDKWDIMYLDWLLIKIIDSFFSDVSSYASVFLNKVKYLESKGYYVDDWLKKYSLITSYRKKITGV